MDLCRFAGKLRLCGDDDDCLHVAFEWWLGKFLTSNWYGETITWSAHTCCMRNLNLLKGDRLLIPYSYRYRLISFF